MTKRERSSSDPISSFNHGSDVNNLGLIRENVESLNTDHGWLPSPVSNIWISPMPEHRTNTGLVEIGPLTLQSATSRAVTNHIDLNVAYEDSYAEADQEITVDYVSQTSGSERNTEIQERNTRRRMNSANQQEFSSSSLSSASYVGSSSQLFQPSYSNWTTSPSSISTSSNSPVIAPSGRDAFRQQDNSQYVPRSASRQSMLVSEIDRGNSSRQILMTSGVVPRNYDYQTGASAASAGSQLSPPLGIPQQNASRSSQSSFSYGVHLSSMRRLADFGSGGQIAFALPASSSSVNMRNLRESRLDNARAFQTLPRVDNMVLRTLLSLQSLIDVQSRVRVLTVHQAFDILRNFGLVGETTSQNEDGFMVHGPLNEGQAVGEDLYHNMRFDIHDFSYEELLALENQIRNVSTGLSEDAILGALRRRTFQSTRLGPPVDEMCVICQEDPVDGEEIGKLDCSHEFHYDCIKQWLLLKNSCPICKATGLAV